jgi:hypothetical protein
VRFVRAVEQTPADGCGHAGIEAFQHAEFFHLPGPGGAGGRCEVGQQAGQQNLAPAERPGRGTAAAQFRGFVERGVQIVEVDAALVEVSAEARQRQVSMHPDGRFRRCQGVAEGQVLEAVQGVVMHEIPDRRLRRQHVLEPV